MPLLRAAAPRAALYAGKALPYVGWLTTIGIGGYELTNALLGNQVPGQTNAINVEELLQRQQAAFELRLAAERNRQNARDVADAYTRGLLQGGAAARPPPPKEEVKPQGTAITNAMIEEKQKTGWRARAAAIASSPLFLPIAIPILTAVLAKRSGGAPRPADEPFVDPGLTGFDTGGVEFLGGQLGGVPLPDEQLAPQEGVADSKCEKIDPKREPGQCRQGWFSETPTKLFLKEWSRRPCQ